MAGWIEPNIHPVFVHFALALIVTAALCCVIAVLSRRPERRRSAMHASDWMLGIGVVAVAASVAAGLQAYYTVAHDGPSHVAMTAHRNWAIASAVLVVAIALWRYVTRHAEPSRFFAAGLVVAALAVGATAARGGGLVYQYGLGVAALPEVGADGHDHHGHSAHDHADGDSGTGQTDDHAHARADVSVTAPHASDHDSDHAHAESDHHAHSESTSQDTIDARSPLERQMLAVADDFAQAIRSGDADAVKALVTQDLWVAEGGTVERSFAEYAAHHLPSDMAFAAATTSNTVDQRVIGGEHLAVVIRQFQLHGEYRNQVIHSQLVETLVLAHQGESWRVRHVHWSSAPLDGEHTH
ncbi:MAG: DUF2231 domain-containing protein [Pseudomonadota bacterium]